MQDPSGAAIFPIKNVYAACVTNLAVCTMILVVQYIPNMYRRSQLCTYCNLIRFCVSSTPSVTLPTLSYYSYRLSYTHCIQQSKKKYLSRYDSNSKTSNMSSKYLATRRYILYTIYTHLNILPMHW